MMQSAGTIASLEHEMEQYEDAEADYAEQLETNDLTSSYENIARPDEVDRLSASLESLRSGDSNDQDATKDDKPLGLSWFRNNNGSSSAVSMTGSNHSLGSFLGHSYSTADQIVTHFNMPVFKISETKTVFRNLFLGTETWGKLYARLPVSVTTAGTGMSKLMHGVQRACKASQLDHLAELIGLLEYRRYTISALIVEEILPVFGPGLVQGFHSEFNAELKDIENGLVRSRGHRAMLHNWALKRRCEMLAEIFANPDFSLWKDKQIIQKTHHIMDLLCVLVPDELKKEAQSDLRRLVTEA